jgi:16S rRNA (guanine527-N7)-methyltransferase
VLGVGDPALHEALASSQRLGMLGARPIGEVIEHSLAFVAPLADVAGTVVDVGSGGGVPGLVIAAARPDLCLVLVDRRASRTDHLRRLVRRLGLDDRVAVVTAGAGDVVLERLAAAAVARGFAAPDVTLRAAARLVAGAGSIVVSEPPMGRRWPPELLDVCQVQRVPWTDPRVAVFRRDVPRET